MKKIKVTLTFTEQMLGTKPANKEVFATYVAGKHPEGTPQRDELENADRIEEAGTTVFHRLEDGTPALYDYQVKGFFKDACGGLRRVEGSTSSKLKAYKSVIDSCIFVGPRLLKLELPEGAAVGICERPLRAETMQGPRVALARSESVPAGTVMSFEITVLQDGLVDVVKDWLDYGSLRGIGQWRNSGCGRFEYQVN